LKYTFIVPKILLSGGGRLWEQCGKKETIMIP
jgi:hypothetical protein